MHDNLLLSPFNPTQVFGGARQRLAYLKTIIFIYMLANSKTFLQLKTVSPLYSLSTKEHQQVFQLHYVSLCEYLYFSEKQIYLICFSENKDKIYIYFMNLCKRVTKGCCHYIIISFLTSQISNLILA